MIIKKHLIKIETADNDLFLFITSLLRRIEKKHSDHLEVVEVDNNYQTILFMSSSSVGANLSSVLMDEQQLQRLSQIQRTSSYTITTV
jgi:hypothetical protein